MSISQKYRYPGLLPFTTQQTDIFFGRDNDRERLLSLILLEKLTVLFGKSGYGKSSLLNAGIVPGLTKATRRGKREYVPVFIRFNNYESDGQTGWFPRFLFQLNQSTATSSLAQRAFLPATLWGELKRIQTQPNQVFVLIFDQFEEFFTFPEVQQKAFKTQLADLLYADIPEYLEQHEGRHSPAEVALMAEKVEAKAVFSLRSDRLSLLDQMKDKLPAILHKRYELLALSRAQAQDALVEPARKTGLFASDAFDWSPPALERLLHTLSHDKQGRDVGVEAFQLQILAQHLENRVIRGEILDRDGDGTPDVFPEDLPVDLENIYSEYYQNISRQHPQASQLIEEGLIFASEEGEARRLSMDGDVLRQQFGADDALLKSLEDAFILRREANSVGGWSYELSHDTLVKPVLEARNLRRAEVKRLRNERRAKEAEARAEKEISRRMEAEKRRYRAVLLASAAVAGLLLAMVVGIWALGQKATAENEKHRAENALSAYQVAEAKRLIAERGKKRDELEKTLQNIETILQSPKGCPDSLQRAQLDTLPPYYPEDTLLQRHVLDLKQKIIHKKCQ